MTKIVFFNILALSMVMFFVNFNFADFYFSSFHKVVICLDVYEVLAITTAELYKKIKIKQTLQLPSGIDVFK